MEYQIIVRDSERQLAEGVRVAHLSGLTAVGPLIVDGGRVLQVLRQVADGQPCDGNGREIE